MKILIVADGFFPGKKYGGPPVSTDNFCSLMDAYECFIITRDHDLGEKTRYENINSGWNDRGNSKVLYLADNEYGVSAFEKAICEIKPDVIYLQSLFQRCVLPCLFLSKKYGIKVLLAPRGELCAGAFRKKYKKIPYIFVLRSMRLLENVWFQSTSDEETQAIAKRLGATAERVFYLTNIPSIPKQAFQYSQKKAGEAKLVFLSRIHPKKNLIQAIRCLKRVNGTVTLDIYGSLEDESYWTLCQSEMNTLPENVTVNYCGLAIHEEVHKTFSGYDAFIFPTLSENYGHVIFEALVSGCPVILSDRTPWNDLETEGAGYVCRLEDHTAFERAVQEVVDSCDDSSRMRAKAYAQKCLDLGKLREKYAHAFSIIMEDVH